MFSQAYVKNSVRGEAVSQHAMGTGGVHPLGRHPSGQTPQWADTPVGRHPLGRHTPGQTPPSPRWPLKRVVCILLE